MGTTYNFFAGKNLDRLSALSDGIFSFALTLLVLDLRVPASAVIHSQHDLWRELWTLAPRLVPYVMTFMTLGIFWLGQQAQFDHMKQSDRGFTWIHVAFLFAVSLTPFSTALLAEFMTYRAALLVYWFDIVLLGATLYWSWRYAVKAGLVKDETPSEVHFAVLRRIEAAQSLYAFGALLCIFSTYASIAFIVLVQLNYVIAPRVRWLAWIP